jgi:hypothetical protein
VWNSKLKPDGQHVITARAADDAANTSALPDSTRTVTIRNTTGAPAPTATPTPTDRLHEHQADGVGGAAAADRNEPVPLHPPADSAICVTKTADQTSRGNTAANAYVPSDTQLAAFRATPDERGDSPAQAMYYPGTYVTGRHSLASSPPRMT